MNPIVNAPIHAATTTLTATVTAMSMIVAITGLSAFAFFLNFLNFNLFLLPSFGFLNIRSAQNLNKYYDLIHNIIDMLNKKTAGSPFNGKTQLAFK
jgi:hypothetical protein